MQDRHARHRRTDADRRRRPVDGYRTSGSARFARLVDDAVSALPSGVRALLRDVQISVEAVPPADLQGRVEQLLLARFDPVGSGSGRGADAEGRVVIFRRPLEARAHDKRDLTELVQDAVVEELARHLDLDEDGLDELGWS